MGSLFPRLPDEIGLECLLRVKLNSHPKLRCVCKSWNAALKNPHFYQERKRLKFSEQRICLVQTTARVAIYDLAENSCKSLPPIPAEINRFARCYIVKQKLVFFTQFRESERSCVWLYDFSCSKWRQGAETPMDICDLRNGFASAADEHGGLIYIGGGFPNHQSASVYNVEEDKWDVLPNMKALSDAFMGAFADGKFYVFYWGWFGFYDSYTRSWTTMENINRFSNCRCFLSAFGRLHCFFDRGVVEYDYSQNKLNMVGTFPAEDWGQFIIFAVVVNNKIFVGKLDPYQGQWFYMLEPPSERGGEFKLIGIERPSGLQGYAMCAATLDL